MWLRALIHCSGQPCPSYWQQFFPHYYFVSGLIYDSHNHFPYVDIKLPFWEPFPCWWQCVHTMETITLLWALISYYGDHFYFIFYVGKQQMIPCVGTLIFCLCVVEMEVKDNSKTPLWKYGTTIGAKEIICNLCDHILW